MNVRDVFADPTLQPPEPSATASHPAFARVESPPPLAEFQLGPWRVIPERNLVVRDTERRHLPPRNMDVLAYLASKRGHVASKTDLLDRVWCGVYVEDGAVARAISELRRTLDDDVTSPRFIETIRGRGYRILPEALAPDDAPLELRSESMGLTEVLSEQRATHDELALIEARFRAMVEAAPIGVFLADEHGAISQVNRQFCEIARLEPDHAQGRAWFSVVHPLDQTRVAARWAELVEDGRPLELACRWIGAWPKVTPVRIRARRVDPDRPQSGIAGTVEDISMVTRAVEERDNLRHLVEALPQGLCLLDGTGCCREAVDWDVLLPTCLDPASLRGRHVRELVPRRLFSGGFWEIVEEVLSGARTEPSTMRWRSGEAGQPALRLSCSPVLGDEPGAVLVVDVDCHRTEEGD